MATNPNYTPVLQIDRVMPQNEDAERSVLGAMLLDNNCINEAFELLDVDSFYNTNHVIIFKAIKEIFEQNNSVDLVTLTEELSRMSKVEAVGGASYLTALVENVVTTVNISDHAQILKEKAIARRLIRVADDISRKSYDAAMDINSIVEDAERQILEIAQRKEHRDISELHELLPLVVQQIDLIHSRKGGLTGLSTGLKQLNNLTGGLQKSDLVIIAARPSVGKTSFALNLSTHVALPTSTNPGTPVVIFSLEMSKEQIVQRMVCTEAGVSSERIRDGLLSTRNLKEILHAATKLASAKIFIDDTPGISVLELRAKAIRLKSKCPELGLIFIDYLQLMTSRSRIESRQQEISEISRSLKALARELKVPVIALSQLNRQVELRGKDAKPQLSDLRESGALEQDADVIMFLHRPAEKAAPGDATAMDQNNIIKLILAKQRNGPTGEIDLRFIYQYTKFAESTDLTPPPDMSYGEEVDSSEEEPF